MDYGSGRRAASGGMAVCVLGLLGIVPQFSEAQSTSCGSYPGVNSLDAAVASSPSGEVNIFFGTASNGMGRLYGDPRTSHALTFENLGGVMGSEPSAVSWGSGHVAVFVRGSNGALWNLQWDNGSATGWQSLGGGVTWNPYPVSTAPGNILAFYRGTNKQLWYRELSGGVWGPHQSLVGVLTSSPVAVSWGPGHVAVFTRGQANDLWYRQRIGSTWGPWVGLGGNFGGSENPDPVVVSRGVGLMDVFVNTSGTVSKISFNGSSWSGWQNLSSPQGAATSEEPGAAATTAGALVVFARQTTLGDPIPLRRIFRKTSTDGGVTWTEWELIMSQNSASSTNPEATANAFAGYTLAAPSGGSSAALEVCSTYF